MAKDKDDKTPTLGGRHGIDRVYDPGAGNDEAAHRQAMIEKYKRDMAPYEEKRLTEDRGELVKMYRANPRPWPDGIDTEADGSWYRKDPEAWDDEGNYIKKINTPAEKAEKLAKGAAVLADIEAKLGIAPAKRGGRQPLGEPWISLGISRRSYFDRKAKGEFADKPGET